MISEKLKEYYKTPEWQRLRSIRLSIDNFKCQKCGRPMDLDVHHVHYPEVLGTEDPYRDLITLCRYCHEEVEQQKNEYRAQRQAVWDEEKRIRDCKRERDFEILWKIIRAKADINDLSNVGIGDRDYCNIDTVKADFDRIIKEYDIQVGYVERVISYCRNKRYRIILDMLEHGYPPDIIRNQTLFSYKMIQKVAHDPEKAKEILNRGIR